MAIKEPRESLAVRTLQALARYKQNGLVHESTGVLDKGDTLFYELARKMYKEAYGEDTREANPDPR